jgi:ERCC4-type nuclease
MVIHRLIADYREKRSGLVQCLHRLGLEPAFSRLDVGDYVVSNSIAIERKTPLDLVSSILDGRFQDQLSRLKAAYPLPMVLIVGGLAESVATSPNPSMVYSLIAKAVMNRVNFVVFEDYSQAAEFIKWLIAETATEKKTGYGPLIRRKPKGTKTYEQVYNVLTSLPGVGPVTAQKLIRSFGSLSKIFTSSESQLAASLGPAKAKKLVRIFGATVIESEKNTSLTDFMGDNMV